MVLNLWVRTPTWERRKLGIKGRRTCWRCRGDGGNQRRRLHVCYYCLPSFTASVRADLITGAQRLSGPQQNHRFCGGIHFRSLSLSSYKLPSRLETIMHAGAAQGERKAHVASPLLICPVLGTFWFSIRSPGLNGAYDISFLNGIKCNT